MSQLKTICEASSLYQDSPKSFKINGHRIVLIRHGEDIYALKDECTHEEFPLSEGWVEDGCLHCAFHGAKFDLKTGAALSLPAYESVKTYPVQVIDGKVKIALE